MAGRQLEACGTRPAPIWFARRKRRATLTNQKPQGNQRVICLSCLASAGRPACLPVVLVLLVASLTGQSAGDPDGAGRESIRLSPQPKGFCWLLHATSTRFTLSTSSHSLCGPRTWSRWPKPTIRPLCWSSATSNLSTFNIMGLLNATTTTTTTTSVQTLMIVRDLRLPACLSVRLSVRPLNSEQWSCSSSLTCGSSAVRVFCHLNSARLSPSCDDSAATTTTTTTTTARVSPFGAQTLGSSLGLLRPSLAYFGHHHHHHQRTWHPSGVGSI